MERIDESWIQAVTEYSIPQVQGIQNSRENRANPQYYIGNNPALATIGYFWTKGNTDTNQVDATKSYGPIFDITSTVIVPHAWTCLRTGTGVYSLNHHLGTTDLHVSMTPIGNIPVFISSMNNDTIVFSTGGVDAVIAFTLSVIP